MIKTITYGFILALLGVSIYFFIFKKTDNPYGQKEAGFNIKDTANIGKMFIATNDGESITVVRKGSEWILNGKHKALPGTVNMVLQTLVTQNALYPVTQKAQENAIKLLATDGIKVELYDLKMAKICAFYVGSPAVNESGTNMLMEGATTPYVVQTAAFTGSLRPRYTTSIREWRDRTVFNIPANEIKSVSVQYEGKPINSYVITRNNNEYTLKGDPAITESLGPLNTHRAEVYMQYFTDINCEGYLNGLDSMNTIIKNTDKMSVIDIETIKGTHQRADIFWMPLNKRSKNMLTANEDVPDNYDADRLFAIINNNEDTVQIQTLTFRKIFRKTFEFYQKDAPQTAAQQQRPNQKWPVMPKNK